MKKRNLVEDHPIIIPTMLQFLSDKIFKVSAKPSDPMGIVLKDLFVTGYEAN
jgi:hypothetical protein